MGGDDPHFDMQDYLINWNAGPFGLVLRPDLGSDMPPCVAQVLQEQSVAKLSGVKAGDMLISVNGKKTTKLGYEKVVKMLYKERLPVILHFRTPQAKRAGGSDTNATNNHHEDRRLMERGLSSQRSTQLQPPPTPTAPGLHQMPRQRVLSSQDFDTRSVTSSTSSRAAPRANMDGGDQRKVRKQYSAVWERGSLGISFRPYSSRVNVPCVDFIGSRGEGRGMERVCVNDVLIAINGEKTKALGVERVLRWLLVIEKPVVLRFHSSSNRVVQNQSNSIESYQPEYEPRTTEASRFQVLYEPLQAPPAAGVGSQQGDLRRQNNHSVNSYHIETQNPTDRSDHRDRRYTNNALPRKNQIFLDHGRPQEPQRRYTNNGMPPPEFDARIDTRPDLRRHQSNNGAPAEYEQPRVERSRRHSNGSQTSGFIPQVLPRREERQERNQPVVEYLSNDRILYDPELFQKKTENSGGRQEQPREPELERPHQRLDSASTRELSFDEAVRIVARSSGKPVTECVFGGVPILSIREGSAQAKLMLIFAKACLAKETGPSGTGAPSVVDRQRTQSSASSASAISLDARSTVPAGDFTRDFPQQQQHRSTSGNPLGRHRSSQFLSYKFAQDHDDKRSRAMSSDASLELPQVFNEPSQPVPVQRPGNGFVPYVAETKAQAPPVLVAPSSTIQPQNPANPSAPAPSSGDFISLKDFIVQDDGQIADRATASSVNSASTHVQSVDSEEDLLTAGSHLVSLAHVERKDTVETKSNQSQSSSVDAFDRRALNNTDISMSVKVEEEKFGSDMISLSDLAVSSSKNEDTKEEAKPNEQSHDIEKEVQEEKSSLLHPLIAELYWGLPDLHNLVKDKPVNTLLQKKEMLDEIQDILQSLQMEAQFERHSHLGVGTLPSLPHAMDTSPSSPSTSTRGKCCYQCGKTGELADLAVDGGRRELYCQDCWEVFFFSEDRLQEADAESPSATAHSVGRDSSDDEAFKYSFHDSSVSRADMLNPWRYLNGGSSSIRDSTTTIGSSLTDRTDEVWL